MTAYAYFIPKDADFDPYTPKLSDIYNAIKQPLTLGFDPAERIERTYAAPLVYFDYKPMDDKVSDDWDFLNFVNYTPKEHDMVSLNDSITLNTAINYLCNLAVLPEAQIGVTNGQQGKNPWTATVGSSSISHKSSPENHLRLALEHLVAAQTIPTLVKARAEYEEAQQAKYDADLKAQEEAAELDAFLCSDEALDGLEAYNDYFASLYTSWREVEGFRGHLWQSTVKGVAQQWIERVALARTEKEKADTRYRAKRRDELVKEFTDSPTGAWASASGLAQTAIDRVITWEINDGALK